MSDLHIMRGDELPIQLHRGEYPSLGAIVAVWDSLAAQFTLHPDDCGLWTCSFDPHIGTSLWHVVPHRKKFGAAEAGYKDTQVYRNWRMTPTPDARVVVVDSEQDYHALLQEFGYRLGGDLFHVWRIDWERLAFNFDGFRVTDAGIRAVGQVSHSPLAAWCDESTLWFNGCFTDIQLFEFPPDTPDYVSACERHAEDQAAIQAGLALPDAFHPEIDSGYLTVPVHPADPDDTGLVLRLARLCLCMTGFGPAWFEVADPADQEEIQRTMHMLAVVDIRDRRAVGFAVVCDLTSWGECSIHDRQCAVGERYAVPAVYMLFVCSEDADEFTARAPGLIRAAAQARGVKPHELAFRGPLAGEYWQVVKRFARYGRVRLAGSVNPYR